MFAPSVYAADGAVSRVIPSGDITKTTAGRATDAMAETTKSASRTAVSRIVSEKNNSEKKLDVDVAVLFYSGETLVGYDTVFYTNVLAGEVSSDKVYIPYDDNYEPITYTNVKTEIIYANAKEN
jgi:hypothetical protein